MSFSEMLLIIMNSVCISIFLGALANLSVIGVKAEAAVDGSPMLINNRFSWMIYMLLLIAWLQFSQRLDSYMNSLGLSTAQTGGSLGASVLAGVGAAVGIGRAVSNGVRGTHTFQSMKKAGIRDGQGGKIGAGIRGAKDTIKSGAGSAAKSIGWNNDTLQKTADNSNERIAFLYADEWG